MYRKRRLQTLLQAFFSPFLDLKFAEETGTSQVASESRENTALVCRQASNSHTPHGTNANDASAESMYGQASNLHAPHSTNVINSVASPCDHGPTCHTQHGTNANDDSADKSQSSKGDMSVKDNDPTKEASVLPDWEKKLIPDSVCGHLRLVFALLQFSKRR